MAHVHHSKLLRALFESTAQFVCLLMPDGSVIEANPTALGLGGLRAEDVAEQPLWQCPWWSPEARAQLYTDVQRASKGSSATGSATLVCDRSTPMYLDYVLKPICDAADSVTLIVFEGHDVTAQRETEEVRLALTAAQMGTWDFNLVTQEVLRSRGTDDLFGFPADNAPRSTTDYLQRIHPNDLERVRAAMAQSAEQQEEHYVEYRVVRPDGSMRWGASRGNALFDANKKPIRVVGVLTDITERRQAEEALREREEWWQLALGVANLGTWQQDIETGQMYFDERVQTLLGVARRTMSFEEAFAFVHPDDCEWVWQASTTAHDPASSGDYNGEYRIILADSSERWIAMRGKVYFDGEGDDRHPTRFIGIMQDITERKQVEQALRQSEAEYRAIFDVAGVGKSESHPATGVFMRVNPKFCHMTGYALDEIISKSFIEITHPDDREADLAGYERLVRGEIDEHYVEKRCVRKDGSVFWGSVTTTLQRSGDGTPCRAFGTIYDITKRKVAEAALRESEARFRGTFDNATIGIAHVAMNGTWLRVNPRLCTIIGYTEAELLQTTFQGITHPDDVLTDIVQFQQLMRGEISGYQMEKRYFHKDGHLIWVYLTTALQCDEHNQPLYCISIVEDITERKQAEAELQMAKETAEAANQMKSVFLANMSHEIRTPLTSMIGYASLLARRLEGKHRVHAQRIEDGGKRLTETLNAVLTLAKLEAERVDMSLEPLVVSQEVRSIVYFHRPLATEKGLQLRSTVNAASRGVKARLDRGGLTSVVQNLISNAIKFTPSGSVTVTVAANQRVPVAATAPAQTVDQWVNIRVEDTGIGMATEFVPYLFDAFRQESTGVNRTYEGSGLGLSIARQLTERMGGVITVESTKDVGSCFTVSFPQMTEVEEQAHGNHDAAVVSAVQPRHHVLLVEDNDATRAMLTELLDDHYQVTAINNPQTVMKLIDERIATTNRAFDVVLMDINLGSDVTGSDLLVKLRSIPAYSHVPVIAMTAYALPGDRETFLGVGFDSYLRKPFTVEELIELMASMLTVNGA